MAQQPIRAPLRGGNEKTADEEEGPESPEALFISALVEDGQFSPASHHIALEDLSCWGRVFSFCLEHQTTTGKAPDPALLARKFPRFELTHGIDPRWAGEQLARAAAGRSLRTNIGTALKELQDEDVDAAYATFAGMKPPRRAKITPVSIFDHEAVQERYDVKRIEVPYPILGRATGGIGTGELWLVAARLGAGKTHVGIDYLALAAKLGYHCGIVAMEMPARQVVDRVLKRLCGSDLKLLELLEHGDVSQRKRAVDVIQERVPGSVEVLDPSHGDIHSTITIQEVCHDYDLLMIDHVGLLKDPAGRRAIDDWRVQALISNILREITLATNGRILGLVQTNRESDTETARPPKASQLSQADALGQDADVVVTMKRITNRVLVHEAVKVREGPTVRWYSRFDPAENLWHQMGKQEADDLIEADRARERQT